MPCDLPAMRYLVPRTNVMGLGSPCCQIFCCVTLSFYLFTAWGLVETNAMSTSKTTTLGDEHGDTTPPMCNCKDGTKSLSLYIIICVMAGLLVGLIFSLMIFKYCRTRNPQKVSTPRSSIQRTFSTNDVHLYESVRNSCATINLQGLNLCDSDEMLENTSFCDERSVISVLFGGERQVLSNGFCYNDMSKRMLTAPVPRKHSRSLLLRHSKSETGLHSIIDGECYSERDVFNEEKGYIPPMTHASSASEQSLVDDSVWLNSSSLSCLDKTSSNEDVVRATVSPVSPLSPSAPLQKHPLYKRRVCNGRFRKPGYPELYSRFRDSISLSQSFSHLDHHDALWSVSKVSRCGNGFLAPQPIAYSHFSSLMRVSDDNDSLSEDPDGFSPTLAPSIILRSPNSGTAHPIHKSSSSIFWNQDNYIRASSVSQSSPYLTDSPHPQRTRHENEAGTGDKQVQAPEKAPLDNPSLDLMRVSDLSDNNGVRSAGPLSSSRRSLSPSTSETSTLVGEPPQNKSAIQKGHFVPESPSNCLIKLAVCHGSHGPPVATRVGAGRENIESGRNNRQSPQPSVLQEPQTTGSENGYDITSETIQEEKKSQPQENHKRRPTAIPRKTVLNSDICQRNRANAVVNNGNGVVENGICEIGNDSNRSVDNKLSPQLILFKKGGTLSMTKEDEIFL